MAEHRVGFLQGVSPLADLLDRDAELGGDLLHRLVVVRQELVQGWIEEADRHRPVAHLAEDAEEVLALHRQDLRERGPALVERLGQDHLSHRHDAPGLEEHVLRAAQADALGAEDPSDARVVGRVGVGADAEPAPRVGPLEDARERAINGGILRLDRALERDLQDLRGPRRQLAEQHLARRAVDGQPVAFGRLQALCVCPDLLVGVIHGDLARAHDAGLAHAARHDRGVGGRSPAGREDAGRGMHAGDVLGRSLLPHEHDRLALGRHGDGADGRQRDAPARGARTGRQSLAQLPPGLHGRGLLLRVEHGGEKLHELLRLDASHRFLGVDQSLVHHVGRDAHGGEPRPLAVARLEKVELVFLDRELEILHVAEASLEALAHALQLRVCLRHRLLKRGSRPVRIQGPGRADTRDDVFALGVREKLAVELLFAGGRVARERDARRRGFAPVAEHHRLHVDRGSPVVRNVVELSIRLGSFVVPRPEDRGDRTPELLAWVVREVVAGSLTHDLLAAPHDLRQIRRREVHVRGGAARLLDLLHRLFELVPRNAQHDVAVHFDEPPATVEGEPLAGARGEAPDAPRRQAQVQDRVHHPGHRGSRPRADRHEQWIVRIAEALVGLVLEPDQRRLDLGADAVEGRAARYVRADGGLDREARRHRNPEGRHLRQARALAAQRLLTETRAFRDAVAEGENPFHFSTTISEKSARLVNSFWMEASSASRFRRRSSSGQFTRTSTKKRSSEGAIEAIVSMASR